MPDVPLMNEEEISKLPALLLLQKLGYQYLSPEEATASRGKRLNTVILDSVLLEQLRRMNCIRSRGRRYSFSEDNLSGALQMIKDVMNDGLIRTNEKIYNLLCLGTSRSQSIDGDPKSFLLHYIDWKNPERNVFHVVEEYIVERTGAHQYYTPDLVLFVNGIPLVVIECKSPNTGTANSDPIDQAISQHIRNQKEDGIPRLFIYSQLLLSLSKNAAKYATTGTPPKFWSVWKEDGVDPAINDLINQPLPNSLMDKLFAKRNRQIRDHFRSIGEREITEQDRTLYCLCSPKRLLELIYKYIVFDAGEKKIARYQQYFTVNNILERISRLDQRGKRQGGVVWHTQGSGKSLTMVMLAKSIALEPSIREYKIVLVTDRIDLDDQIYTTFKHCGKEVVQAKTGANLLSLLEDKKQRIVTTIIDKFDAAVSGKCDPLKNGDIFVLVDESHRGQYGPRHAKMEKTLPNACYIGFTGTPVMSKHKNTVGQFGGIIPPAYTMRDAVEDKAVVPLLYEGRHVHQEVYKEPIDTWFQRLTAPLSKEQVADLKRKYSSTSEINKALQTVKQIAWDVSEHFRDNWQGTGFKAQLVTPDKPTALLYKKILDEFGAVSSEVLISGPDQREGEVDIREENTLEVNRFWSAMMDKYGSEKDYNREVINAFKFDDTPEIIIVVSKLLTGFDAPRNTVLYLAKKMQGHNLLQAIARVNRLHDGKDFGYILDYWGVLSELDEALTFYDNLSEYDEEDLKSLAVNDVEKEIEKLPQLHSDLWDVFKDIRNTKDEEQYEMLLAPRNIRDKFYERFSEFSRTLAIAISTTRFIEETDEETINLYKRDLNFFAHLKVNVQRRYAEVINFSDYQPQIKKLIDTYVGAGEIEKLNAPVNIFDTEAFDKEVERQVGDAAKADLIAHNTKRTITEKMQEDPYFYKKFSQLLEEAIRAFHDERVIQASEYLKRVKAIMSSVITRTGDDLPNVLRQNDVAKAFYGCIQDIFENRSLDELEKEIWAQAAIEIENIIRKLKKVDWEADIDKQNQMRNAIDDFLFDFKKSKGFDISSDQIDQIMEKCIDIAKVRIH